MPELFRLLPGQSPVPLHRIGARWLQAIEGIDGGRLRRGRAYSRSGHVTNLSVTEDGVTARVRGSAYTPYQVRLRIPPISAGAWEEIIADLAGDATVVAALLAGDVPSEVEQALARHGEALFPASMLDVEDDCTCYDWSRPCKHIAAVYYVIADWLSQEPQTIFPLRGLATATLLERMEAVRARLLAERFGDHEPPDGEIATEADADLAGRNFWAAGLPLDTIPVRFDPPAAHAQMLKALGPAPYGYDRREFMATAEQVYAAISRAGLMLLSDRGIDQATADLPLLPSETGPGERGPLGEVRSARERVVK